MKKGRENKMSLVEQVLRNRENVERREELRKVLNREVTVEGKVGTMDKYSKGKNRTRVCIEDVEVKGLEHETYSHIWIQVSKELGEILSENKGVDVTFRARPTRYSRHDFTWAYGLKDVNRLYISDN